MTENKRFMLDDAGEVIDLHTHQFIEYGDEIVECLNNLHEENQSLKQQLKNLRRLANELYMEKTE
jgi:cell shape-determining protein MreC